MTKKTPNLGKIISEYPIAPAYLQRTVIVAVLSFLFFLAASVMFSIWKNFLYFFLATGFLVVYIFTMFGWFFLRKNTLKIYENGLSYRKFKALWNEIEAVETSAKNGGMTCEIRKKKGEKMILSEAIYNVEQAVRLIESKVQN